MTQPPEFIMPAKPGPDEKRLLTLAEMAADRDLRQPEIAKVISLIRGGADMAVYDEDSRATVFEKLIHVALQSHAVAELPQYKGQKLLDEIFRVQPDVAEIKELIADGADIAQRDLYRRTGLILAANAGRNDIAKLLLAGGVEIDAQDRDGETALIIAARQGNAELVELLLEKGARQDLCTTYGQTAVIAAVVRADEGMLDPVRLKIALALVVAGADAAERIGETKSALDRLREAGCTHESALLETAAMEYRHKAAERNAEGTPLLKILQQKKPGDKFKLPPRH